MWTVFVKNMMILFISEWFLSPHLARSRRAFLSDIYCESLIKFLVVSPKKCGASLPAGFSPRWSVYGRSGSLLLLAGFSRFCDRGCSPGVVLGFSLRWHLLLLSMGPRHTGLVALRHMGSSQTRDQTCVPCVSRRILSRWPAKDVLLEF